MADQIELNLRLIYPPSLINVPVIQQLIRTFDITVNILRAQITAEEGWIEIQVTGEQSVLDKAMEWLKSQGIECQPR